MAASNPPEREILLLGGVVTRQVTPDDAPQPSDEAATAAAAPSTSRREVRGLAAVLAGLAGAALLAAAAGYAAEGSAAGYAAGARPALLGRRRPTGDGVVQLDVVKKSDDAKCAEGSADCTDSQCCSAPGMQCYEQQPGGYAQCRASCTPGPDPTHWDSKKWTCKALGERAAGDDQCGAAWEGCAKSHCCKDVGFQCYEKNSTWATCKTDCVAGGPDLSDADSKPWTCQKLGERVPGTQKWVQAECSAGLDNCVSTQCCKNAGEQCALQNDYYGNCMVGCVGRGNGDPWSCKKSGPRTPTAPIKGGKLAPWVMETCSKANEGCLESKCCIGMNVQCYEKNKDWAQCKPACKAGRDPFDHNETWSCKELGPRSWGVAEKGFPSLYCFSLMRTVGYEVDIMKVQLAKGAGIFGCDETSLLTADGNITLHGGKLGSIKSIQFPGAPVVTSQDGTAGNTQLFVHAWDAVIAAGIWKRHAWTIKADPDAVVIAERLRWHLAPHVGEHIFVLNCNKFPGPNYPMVYGALEVFANSAVQAWAERGHDCAAPNTYGEDYYMTKCMDFLGVGRFLDERILGDNLCMGADCANGWISAFHPFKDVASWEKCWGTAMNSSAPA